MPVYKLFTATDLEPGKTFHFEWNNIPASGKPIAVDAYGYNVGSRSGGYSNTTRVEVARVVRRRRQVAQPGSLGVKVKTHDDVEGEVKNVGGSTLDFDLHLVVFS